ncbi:hypothetical protein ABZP36_031349 [Zizania latifolia]
MRVHEGVSDEKADKEEAEAPDLVTLSTPPAAAAVQRLVVGYALTKKKVKSFLQLNLLALARRAFILFQLMRLVLSLNKSFDIILHKLTNKEWQQVLEDYREEHPEVTILDPPNAIQHLHNRQSMLQEVADLNLSNGYGEVCTPRQLVIMKDPLAIVHTSCSCQGWSDAALGLHSTSLLWPPNCGHARSANGTHLQIHAQKITIEIAKPLVVDGTSKSHELSLAYVETSLSMLDPPIVLQEFVNHVLSLLSVQVGSYLRYMLSVKQYGLSADSLPDVNIYDLENNDGIFRFPRVSCATNNAEDAEVDPCIAELPPRPLLEKLGSELRHRLGLRLFNLDMIREHGRKDRYYVIDINYFPGYGKMPGYEHIFTDFLLSLVQNKYRRLLSES